jgi:hypothetical protein
VRHTGKVQGALAFAVTLGFFVDLYMLMTLQTGGGMRDALLIMVGALGAGFTSVLNYYFGSSSGSQAKDQLLAKEPQ